MKQIEYNGKNYTFEFSDSCKCWSGKILFYDKELEIEIYLKDFTEEEVDWQDLSDFIRQLSPEVLNTLIRKSQMLLMKLIEVTEWYESLSEFRFEFEMVLYKGRKESLIYNTRTHRYALFFQLYKQGYHECYDTYGSYYIEIENALITGCRREQV